VTTNAGIPCAIGSRRVHQALRTVFAAIERHPRDWRRLQRRLIGVEWLETDDGPFGGEWRIDPDHHRALCDETRVHPRLWARQGGESYLARGTIGLDRVTVRATRDQLIALVAHECGHAVTRARDFAARERTSDAEWASELCADLYAFRWGFEREIRADAATPSACWSWPRSACCRRARPDA
jgi:hypothetical protein